jgi:hypothetical protein
MPVLSQIDKAKGCGDFIQFEGTLGDDGIYYSMMVQLDPDTEREAFFLCI